MEKILCERYEMSDKKIQEMFKVLHEENLTILQVLLATHCDKKKFKEIWEQTERDWNEVYNSVIEKE